MCDCRYIHGAHTHNYRLTHTHTHTHILQAQRYDLLIVEDDPYRLLFLPEDPEEVREEAMPGVEGLPLSLLSLDVDGRVGLWWWW